VQAHQSSLRSKHRLRWPAWSEFSPMGDQIDACGMPRCMTSERIRGPRRLALMTPVDTRRTGTHCSASNCRLQVGRVDVDGLDHENVDRHGCRKRLGRG